MPVATTVGAFRGQLAEPAPHAVSFTLVIDALTTTVTCSVLPGARACTSPHAVDLEAGDRLAVVVAKPPSASFLRDVSWSASLS